MEDFNEENINLDEFRFEDNDYKIDSNPELRDYLRIMYDQIKLENKMVGEFSVYGTYKIRPEMQDYLIKEIKIIQGRSGDTVYATRATNEYILNFIITFNIVGKSQQAFLDFEEREIRIDEENIIHKTRLAEIVKTGHPDFVNYVYKEWNVWANGSGFELKDDELMRALLDRIAMFGTLNSMLNAKSLIFVKSMLLLLPSCGKVGNVIATQFSSKLASMILKNPNFENDGLGLKKLLDGLMKKYNFFPILAEKKEAMSIVRDFVEPIKSFDMAKFQNKSKNVDGPSLDAGRHF